ncbi:MAG: hypothetical protein J6Y60_09355 [Treponema sp.]|nr:hypothetical protein [Treponema sp.]
MKRFIFAFVLAISIFGMVGCNHEPTVEPETNTWTYPVAQEDVIKMWVDNNSNGQIYFYVLKSGESGYLKTENQIAGYTLFTSGDSFTVAPFYTSTINHYYYPIDVPLLPCADYQNFINEVRNHPATIASYDLRTDVPGYEEEVEQLWDLFHKLDDFYMAHSGNPAPPLMAE